MKNLLLILCLALTGCFSTATVAPVVNKPSVVEPSDNANAPGGIFNDNAGHPFNGWHVTTGWVDRYQALLKQFAGSRWLPAAPKETAGIVPTGPDYTVTQAVMDLNNEMIGWYLNPNLH